MRCILVGNYGAGNLGDDALRDYFLTRIRDVEWTVVSARPGPGEMPRLPLGVRSFFSFGWLKTLAAVRSTDAVVFGGGSLFTDAESVRACLLWGLHAFVARLFRTPVLLAFQGIGPFRTRLGEWCAKRVVLGARFVSVRDPQSAERVRRWGRGDVLESFDPVVLLLTVRDVPRTTGSALAVIPRMNSGPEFDAAVGSARGLSAMVKILSMQPDDPAESAVCERLARSLGNAEVIAVRTLESLSCQLAGCTSLVTARYHGALAGIAAGLPMEIIPQHPGDKLDALRSRLASGSTPQDLRRLAEAGERELQKSINMVK